VYYSAIIILLGAEITRANCERRGAHIEPKSHYVRAPVPVPMSVAGPDGRLNADGPAGTGNQRRQERAEARR
jgi:hypothetical protein